MASLSGTWPIKVELRTVFKSIFDKARLHRLTHDSPGQSVERVSADSTTPGPANSSIQDCESRGFAEFAGVV